MQGPNNGCMIYLLYLTEWMLNLDWAALCSIPVIVPTFPWGGRKEGRKIYSSLAASKKKKKDLLIHGSQQG